MMERPNSITALETQALQAKHGDPLSVGALAIRKVLLSGLPEIEKRPVVAVLTAQESFRDELPEFATLPENDAWDRLRQMPAYGLAMALRREVAAEQSGNKR